MKRQRVRDKETGYEDKDGILPLNLTRLNTSTKEENIRASSSQRPRSHVSKVDAIQQPVLRGLELIHL